MPIHQNHTLRVTCPDGISRTEAINYATSALANRAATRAARDAENSHPSYHLEWALTAQCSYVEARSIARAAGLPLDPRRIGRAPALHSGLVPGFHTLQPCALPDGWAVEIIGPVPEQVGGQQTPREFWQNWPDRGIN